MDLRVGETIELETSALDDQGCGLAQLPGATVHVAGALAQERTLVQLEHASPHRPGPPSGSARLGWGRGPERQLWGRARAVLTRSAHRVEPVCPAFGRCGGCPVQHLAYPEQLAWKRDKVVAALSPVLPEASRIVAPCVPSPAPLGYRNQAKYVYGIGPGGEPVLGAYAPRSHTLVDLLGCQVVTPVLDRTARVVLDSLITENVAPFDERTSTGLVRHVVLRCDGDGRVLVTLVTRARPWPRAQALASGVLARAPEVVGIVRNLNDRPGNVIFGSQDVCLAGTPSLPVRFGSATVPVGPRAFLQVNFGTAALVLAEIRRAVAGAGRVQRLIDLYAGVGAIAFRVADLAQELVAIEENPAATASGAAAAAAAGLSVSFRTGDVAACLQDLGGADVVVLNPPRAGAGESVTSAIAAARPRLCVYLSCNPKSLAADLLPLQAAGKRAVAVTPFDMHPHTPHVEVLVEMA